MIWKKSDKHAGSLISRVKAVLKLNTIGKKIFLGLTGAVLIPVICTGIIVGVFLSDRADRIYRERMTAELLHVRSLITLFVENVRKDINVISSSPSFRKTGPYTFNRYYNTTRETDLSKVRRSPVEQEVYELLKRMADNHPDYKELYVGTKYGGLVTNGSYKLWAGFDPRVRPWYQKALEKPGEVIVSKSYYSAMGEYVTALARADSGNGSPLFICGIDISLRRLTEVINRIKIGRSGYLVLMEEDGTILANPRYADLNSRKITEIGIPRFENVLPETDKFIYYSFRGSDKMARIINSAETGWKLMAVIDESEIHEAVSYFRFIILITTVLIIIFCVILYSYINRFVVRPVKFLTEFGNRIAEGKLDTPVVLNQEDELGRLAEEFNEMMFRIKESVDSIKAVIEFMPSIIFQTDTEGRIIEGNRLAENLTGPISASRGRLLAEMMPGLEKYFSDMAAILVSQAPVIHYRITLEGYEDRWFNLFIFAMRQQHSEFIVVRLDDITELEKKDEHLRQAQKMESVGMLASGVAHDFNNILGAILATASLVRLRMGRGIDDFTPVIKDLELIENSCEDGAALVSQLLDLSRKETDIEFHAMDLNSLVKQIEKICRKSFDKSISITVSTFDNEALAMINCVQIQQALLNLCINASHAMTIMRKSKEEYGGHLDFGLVPVTGDRFFVESHPGAIQGDYWRIFVRDTGVGMDTKTVSKIFDPFFTTKTSTSIRGTGLGLSTVYSSIRAHNGFIDVYSEPGIGSAFSVYLPVFYGDDSEDEGRGMKKIFHGSGTVLVVDDEEVMRTFTGTMLKECGYRSVLAANGDEAIEIYKAGKDEISCVILDVIMPVKSGFETLRELKRTDPDLSVLMVSGLYSQKLVDELMESGADDFLEKPFSVYTISQKLHSLLADND